MSMMSSGNVCALLVRILALLLCVYAIVLSVMTISSCHFLSAVTPTGETHGVGLTSFELESGVCQSHTGFITSQYNGMEMTAKIGGYVAPSLGAMVVLFILMECCICRGHDWFCNGKCLPCLLLLGSATCQGLTFLLFNSDLFCTKTEEVDKCVMDTAAYRSVQATICYFLCFILYLCGRTPIYPVLTSSGGKGEGKRNNDDHNKQRGGSNTKSKKKKKKKGEFTKEDYEMRRKEKKIKSRGVSGRSKREIYQDIRDGDYDREESNQSSSKKKRQSRNVEDAYYDRVESGRSMKSPTTAPSRDRRNKNERKYDDYVDTEPDGMDWSAYDPKEREEYYEKMRSSRKQQQLKLQDDRNREYYDEDDEQKYRTRNDVDDNYSEYRYRGGGGSRGRSHDDNQSRYSDRSGSRYSDRSGGYVGTVYDSRYSRGSRHTEGYDDESYHSGRRPQDRYAPHDNGDGYEDDYTKGEDSYGEPFDHQDYDSRRGGNDSYIGSRSYHSERSRGRNDEYDEESYNDASYGDIRRYGEEEDVDNYGRRRRDDDYHRPLT